MLTRAQKEEIVRNLEGRFGRQRVSIFADFRGIGVAKLAAFRRELKKIGAEFKVAKKTLLARALAAAGIGIAPKELEGEIGVIFGYEDQTAPAKAAAKFAKDNETFKILKGILEGKILGSGDVLALARLPSRGEVVRLLAYVLNAPVQNLANVLAGNVRNLVMVLGRVRDKR